MAHPGRTRTLETLALNYIWPGVYNDVKNHVKKCKFCSRRKVNTQQAKVPIQKFPIPPYPFFRCHLDFIGPLPMSKSGNTFALVAKDALSKWPEVFGTPECTAAMTAEYLVDEIICRYGSIQELVSDRGHEFINQVIKEVCKLFKIKHLSTTPYHPQGNGMVENFNKTLKDCITAYANAGHDNWDVALPIICHKYRTTVNMATGYTPFFVMFGREAKAVSESWITEFMQQNDLTEFVNRTVILLKQTWSAVGERMSENQMQLNHIVKEPRQFKELKVGQMVFLKQIPKRKYRYYLDSKQYALSSKLQFRYVGPYEIIGKKSPVVYTIQMENKIRVVSIMNLKPA